MTLAIAFMFGVLGAGVVWEKVQNRSTGSGQVLFQTLGVYGVAAVYGMAAWRWLFLQDQSWMVTAHVSAIALAAPTALGVALWPAMRRLHDEEQIQSGAALRYEFADFRHPLNLQR